MNYVYLNQPLIDVFVYFYSPITRVISARINQFMKSARVNQFMKSARVNQFMMTIRHKISKYKHKQGKWNT
jgi:hypothetical protein